MKKIAAIFLFLIYSTCAAQVNPNVGINPNAVVIPGNSNPNFISMLNPCQNGWFFTDGTHQMSYICGPNGTWYTLSTSSVSTGNNAFGVFYPTSIGSVTLTNATFLITSTGDFVIGTASPTNTIHFEVGLNSIDSMTITATGITENVPVTATALPLNQNKLINSNIYGVTLNNQLGALLPQCNALRNYYCVM